MPFINVLDTIGAIAARFAPASRPTQPLEVEFDFDDARDPFEQAAIGRWVTEDGAIRLDLREDGYFHKAKQAQPDAHRGRYAVDRSKLYFEGEAGWVALGQMRRGVLSIGEKRFLKA